MPGAAIMPKASPYPWYALRIQSRKEQLSSQVLSHKGFQSYVPTYRNLRQWSDRCVELDTPLFPGYVFCRFDPRTRLPVLTTPGVISILGFGQEAAPVDDREIEAIQAVLRSGLHVEPCGFLQEGQKVRIVRGSLQGLEGILMHKKTQYRMVISVTMLQRSVTVEIDRDWINGAK